MLIQRRLLNSFNSEVFPLVSRGEWREGVNLGFSDELDMMTVLGWVGTAADMNPVMVAGLAGSLKNQLIGIGVVHEP